MAADVVNLGELAQLLDMSTPTLRELVKKHSDFPVAARGDHGVAYEFDPAAVSAWWGEHKDAIAAAKAERQNELDQYRLDLFGGSVAEETAGLSPTERRAEMDAQIKEDQLRRSRGELLDAAIVDHILRQAMAELAKGMRQIAPALAREHGLDRVLRVGLEAGIRERVNSVIDRVQELLRDDDARAA